MAGITLAEAETQLSTWLSANTAVASGQSYSIAGRTLTRADANHILEQIKFWDSMTKSIEAREARTGPTVRGTIPQ